MSTKKKPVTGKDKLQMRSAGKVGSKGGQKGEAVSSHTKRSECLDQGFGCRPGTKGVEA